jgi:transcriptional regulator with XRE-family HTH domain
MSERAVHHGRNIKRIREIQGIKQEALALELGDDWNQKKVSLLESKEVVDEQLLSEVARALKVTPEAIKNFNEEAAVNIIANNYNGTDQSSAVNFQCTFNPIERWLEALGENKKLYQEKVALYERMLKDKSDLIERLERLLAERR